MIGRGGGDGRGLFCPLSVVSRLLLDVQITHDISLHHVHFVFRNDRHASPLQSGGDISKHNRAPTGTRLSARVWLLLYSLFSREEVSCSIVIKRLIPLRLTRSHCQDNVRHSNTDADSKESFLVMSIPGSIDRADRTLLSRHTSLSIHMTSSLQ